MTPNHPLLPEPSVLSKPFWESAAKGELRVQKCLTCGHYEWTPQAACSRCLTETLSWERCSGRGSIYSYSIVWRPQDDSFRAPYVVAIVELDEGVRMLTEIINVDPSGVEIGMPVQVAFGRSGPPLYHFEPLGGDS